MQSTCGERGNDESNRFIELYRSFASTPVPNKASFHKHGDAYTLRVHYSQRDLDLMEKTIFQKCYAVDVTAVGIGNIQCVTEACDITTELAAKHSNSLNRKVIIRKNPKENQKLKSFIEVWQGDTKIKTLTSEILEKRHGEIILSPYLSAIQWSPNEKSFLYVAEQKSLQSESFFKETPVAVESEKSTSKGTEYVYREEWGEALDGVHHSCVYVVNTEDNFKVRCIEVEHMSLAEPFWIDDNTIGFLGFQEEPYRLGIVYCPIRQNYLYAYDLLNDSSKPEIIYGDDTDVCIRSPRLNPTTKEIVFLCNSTFGPHFKASRLMRYNFETKVADVVVDVKDKDANFIPLYLSEGLPSNCFTVDGGCLLLNSVMKCQSVICYVDLRTKTLKKLNSPDTSAHILDVKHDILVVSSQSPNKIPSVYIAKIIPNAEFLDFKIVDVRFGKKFEDIAYKLEEHLVEDSGAKIALHNILIGPASKMGTATAAIIVPHGGPHSSFGGDYIMTCAMFAKLGYKSLLINYRGSSGVNEDYLHSLCGNVGNMDVNDVMFCIKQQIETGEIDASNIVLYSGSHGGFLITHLCGQFPDFGFKACVARNPVVDIAGMMEVTDIPDWNFTEAIGVEENYKFGNFGSVEVLKSCFEKSPMYHAHKVKTPTFVLLGRNDKRVPMSQGLKYYKTLKARGVDVKCHVYDDKHDLQKVNVDSDAFVNVVLWLSNYIGK